MLDHFSLKIKSETGKHFGKFTIKMKLNARFNNAPTHGYEKHVGTKTSLRIVNSQVVGKPGSKNILLQM